MKRVDTSGKTIQDSVDSIENSVKEIKDTVENIDGCPKVFFMAPNIHQCKKGI